MNALRRITRSALLVATAGVCGHAELHIYETGGHGFGLGKPGTSSAEWPQAFEQWLRAAARTKADQTQMSP